MIRNCEHVVKVSIFCLHKNCVPIKSLEYVIVFTTCYITWESSKTVKIFKGYFKNFMKYLIILLILSIIAYIFTSLPFFAGLCLGITGSMLLSYNWYWNLRNAQLGDGGKVKTGTLTRMLIVTATCLIWVRFPETFN